MDKLRPRSTSSPVGSEAPVSSPLHDSFLEDMQLYSYNSKSSASGKDAERNVTRRTLSPATVSFATVIEEQDRALEQRGGRNSSGSKAMPSAFCKPSRKEVGSTGDPQVVTAAKELKVKIRDSKSRSLDNRIEPKPSETNAAKLKPERQSLAKDRARRSGGYKETESSEVLKENKQPLNSSGQANSRPEAKKEPRETPEYVALLSAVKEVVSTYTKEEGSKVLRALNQLHVLSQASLIKNLMFQTDEIKRDLQIGEHSGQLKGLMEENEMLKENYALLKMKYQDLQTRLEGYEQMREENADLKLKLQEIARQNHK